jgi:hypothetical protein
MITAMKKIDYSDNSEHEARKETTQLTKPLNNLTGL